MHSNRRGFVARLRGQSGYVVGRLVGRLLRRLTFGMPTLDRDPLALHRERGASQRYSRVAQACPTLSEREVVVAREAMVFVHGTASCGLQGLKDLYASALPKYPVLRLSFDSWMVGKLSLIPGSSATQELCPDAAAFRIEQWRRRKGRERQESAWKKTVT